MGHLFITAVFIAHVPSWTPAEDFQEARLALHPAAIMRVLFF